MFASRGGVGISSPSQGGTTITFTGFIYRSKDLGLRV